MDWLEDMWDALLEGLAYIFSFEWAGDLFEFLGAMFDNLNELSVTGTILGILAAGLIFYLETTPYGTISAFTQYMTPISRWTWTILTYIACFAGGYLVGKAFDNT